MGGRELSRRSFLGAAAAAAAATRAGATRGAAQSSILDRLGVALYTVRDQMKSDPAGTLAAIAALGYRYVEGGLLPSLGAACKAAGLGQVSAYAPTYLVTGNRQAWASDDEPLLPESYDWAKAVEEGRAQGLRYLVIAYLQKAERGGLAVYRDVAARLAGAGETCRKAGLGLVYHAHAFEYEPVEGVRPIDVLLDETPKDLVGLELDFFWATIGGGDPMAMLGKHAGRIPLVHLKDLAPGTPVQYDDSKVPHEAFKEIGRGTIDWARLLPAARQAGVQYFYVEQDYCSGSPLDSLRISRETIARLSS
jgi:sugar phosphate isomerase/epimerase